MSIIIKGINKPKSCLDCPCLYDDTGVCRILDRTVLTFESPDVPPEDCPIEEVRHGEWEKMIPKFQYQCTSCGFGSYDETAYCPACGAKMDEKGENMSCNCKHNAERISDGKKVIAELREMFIKRMTVDSTHHDRRRRDYNQAIFFYRDDGSTGACWCDTNMDMVLECFDNAVKDWRRSFCDVEGCNRK